MLNDMLTLQVFQLDQLAIAEQRIARINRSPPPPGLEEKFSSVNSRWQLVVKQTKDRWENGTLRQ